LYEGKEKDRIQDKDTRVIRQFINEKDKLNITQYLPSSLQIIATSALYSIKILHFCIIMLKRTL
jgi:hypothetical protein